MGFLCPSFNPKQMKRSIKPTAYILIKASTNIEWDPIDFAIIHLTALFKDTMRLRLANVIQFKGDDSFHNLTYWDSPSGYYCNSKNGTAKILRQDEDWCFVSLDADDEQTFAVPENQLQAHQLMITKHGYANFKAYSKHTGEEYWTEWFSINQILGGKKIPLLDSS
jgi:hypothetical protein